MPDYTEVIADWNIFRVGLISENGNNVVVKVCLPLDESLVPFVSEKNEPCQIKTEICIYAKKMNQEYLNQIKMHYLINRPSSARLKKPTIINQDLSNMQTQNNLNQNQQLQNFNFKQVTQSQPNLLEITRVQQLNLLNKEQLIQKILELESQIKPGFQPNQPLIAPTQVTQTNYNNSSNFGQSNSNFNSYLGSNTIPQYQQVPQQPVQISNNIPNNFYGIQNLPNQSYFLPSNR